VTAYVSGAVEGLVDQAVFERLVRTVGAEAGPLHRTNGKARLLARLRGFNEAARRSPWLVLVDLDQDADCAPAFLRDRIPAPSEAIACRVAVRSVESWLMADRERMAVLLGVPPQRLVDHPDELPSPKDALIDLARRSSSRDVRADMLPGPGSGRRVGPLYDSRLIEFARDERRGWRPRTAARSSDSLARCLRRLEGLVTRTASG
jgi:hypothetical protein